VTPQVPPRQNRREGSIAASSLILQGLKDLSGFRAEIFIRTNKLGASSLLFFELVCPVEPWQI
jgi:hypothetical protein